MKKTTGLILGCCLVLLPLFTVVAKTNNGGLSDDLIARLRESMVMDAHMRAMINAVSSNDINELAISRSIINSKEDLFSHKIKTKGITDQKSSGRCWMFAGLNVLRPKVMDKYKLDEFEFSQAYLSFWDKLEKSNMFLELIIEYRNSGMLDREMDLIVSDPVGDGGWWSYIVGLIEKYGVVPQTVMPETYNSSNTARINKLLDRTLRSDAVRLRAMAVDGADLEQLRAAKETMLSGVYRMLVMNYGEPPTEFEYRYKIEDSLLSDPKTYTPQSFYKEFVDENLADYVNLFNDPTRDYGKHYQAGVSRNMYDADNAHFVNITIDQLRDISKASILDDQPVWFACDVAQDHNRKMGILAEGLYDYDDIYGVDMSMTKAERILYHETSANHAMVFTGVDIRDDKPVKWLVENSWGDESGVKGMWNMDTAWFDEHVFNIIVKKKYVPKDILKLFDETPIVLPIWDPLHAAFH